MFIQSGPLGAAGIFLDPPPHTLPVGAWSSGLNIRFNDGYIERIREPEFRIAVVEPESDPARWFQQYLDSTGVRVVYATDTKLYRLSLDGTTWEDVSNPFIGGGTYSTGNWQSFPWGLGVVFNNGVNPPQILLDGDANFQTLPGWGMVSDPADLEAGPTIDLGATCTVIRPYLNYMVAINIEVTNTPFDPLVTGRNRNALWHSSAATNPNDPPDWDYTNPASLSQVNIIGIEDGPLIDVEPLNNRLMIYTPATAHAATLTSSSTFPFAYDRVLEYGITSIGAVTTFNNLHFCVAPSTLYVHDGSTVRQIADGRVQETFVKNINGGAEEELPDVLVIENQDTKEIQVLYDDPTGGTAQRRLMIYNYKDDNFSFAQAFVTSATGDIQPVECVQYGFDESQVTTWAEWEADGTTWADLFTRGVTWSELLREGYNAQPFWLTTGGLYEAERQAKSDPNKDYFVERFGIDLSEQNPQATANRWKHLRQLYPHLDLVDTPETRPSDFGEVRFTVGWTQTLLSKTVRNPDQVVYDAFEGDYKVDVRTTGRYLYLRMDGINDGFWRWTSMDYDVELLHRR